MVESIIIRFVFGNNYFSCFVKSRVGMGVGRVVGGICSYLGKRDNDDIC